VELPGRFSEGPTELSTAKKQKEALSKKRRGGPGASVQADQGRGFLLPLKLDLDLKFRQKDRSEEGRVPVMYLPWSG